MAESALSAAWTLGWIIKNTCDQAAQNNKELLKLGNSAMDLLNTIQEDFDQLEQRHGGAGMRERLGSVEITLEHVLRFVKKQSKKGRVSKLWNGSEVSGEIVRMHTRIRSAYDLFGLSTSAEVLLRMRSNTHRIDEISDLVRQVSWACEQKDSGGNRVEPRSSLATNDPLSLGAGAEGLKKVPDKGKTKEVVAVPNPPIPQEKLELNYLRSKIKSLRKQILTLGTAAYGTSSQLDLLQRPSPITPASEWGSFEAGLYRTRLKRCPDGQCPKSHTAEDTQDSVYATLQIIKQIGSVSEDNPIGHIAEGLHILAARLASNFGRSQEASDLSEEALKIRRHLYNLFPSEFRIDLAQTLSTSASYLGDMANHDEAVWRASEAVDVFRKNSIANGNDGESRAALATALYRSAMEQLTVGQSLPALQDITSSVDMQRALVYEDSAVYNPNLAHFLGLQAQILLEVGCADDALAAADEATDLWRRIRADKSELYVNDYAVALLVRSSCLSRCHRPTESLAAAAEAAKIYRGVVDAREVYKSDLGKAVLQSCRQKRVMLTKPQKLLPECKEAITLLKGAIRVRPRHLREYGAALSFQARLLYEATEDPKLANGPLEDALMIQRKLVTGRAKAMREDLAESLYLQTELRQAMGSMQAAALSIGECVAIRKELHREVPEYYSDGLAQAIELQEQVKQGNQSNSVVETRPTLQLTIRNNLL